MPKKFTLILIKPSHYDDDGYVIQWFRSAMPSNSLAVLHGLADECAADNLLGDDIEIEIHSYDETNSRIDTSRIAKLIKQADGGMVMLVGVQSNQFPRALDIAAPLRSRGIMVAIGGFHVSGTIAMLKERDPHVARASEMGISLFAGEAEGRLGQVLLDAWNGELKPLYNFMDDLPNIGGVATPILPAGRVRRTIGSTTSFDAGRGCPYACSFCTIINVQGRVSRRRTPDDIERIVRENVALGLHSFFITDDNFARNKGWEAILDRLIHLREVERLDIKFSIQVDTQCHHLPNFIEKSARAGVKRVFIGLENINPDTLLGARKQQNKLIEYRNMLLQWKHVGMVICCGYILGFPNDTKESILRDIGIIQRELPIDLLEFFCLTPLPGSEDHKKLYDAGVEMDPDLNKYDVTHVTTAHSKMSQQEWEEAYAMAWEKYYSLEHAETIIRRAAATGTSPGKMLFFVTWFKGCHEIEAIHPLEGGFLRIKSRKNRRSGMPIENPLIFYPKYLAETVRKHLQWAALFIRMRLIYKRIKHDPARFDYMDAALEPVTDHEEERDIFQTAAAQNYLEKQHKLERAARGQAV